jgi:site-specific recombinase XerC
VSEMISSSQARPRAIDLRSAARRSNLIGRTRCRSKHAPARVPFDNLRIFVRISCSRSSSTNWEQVDLKSGVLHVRRIKQGTPATHPLTGRELRALRRLEREAEGSPFVFVSARGAPFSTRGFQAMVERAGQVAGFDMKIHPHMLRHACGYKLANDGIDTRTIQGYLGHKSIQHTVRYTELAPTRFKSLFRD